MGNKNIHAETLVNAILLATEHGLWDNALVQHMAKHTPGTFITHVNTLINDIIERFDVRIISNSIINNKIPAIKIWREVTGDGLADAKKSVETDAAINKAPLTKSDAHDLMDKFTKAWFNSYPQSDSDPKYRPPSWKLCPV